MKKTIKIYYNAVNFGDFNDIVNSYIRVDYNKDLLKFLKYLFTKKTEIIEDVEMTSHTEDETDEAEELNQKLEDIEDNGKAGSNFHNKLYGDLMDRNEPKRSREYTIYITKIEEKNEKQ